MSDSIWQVVDPLYIALRWFFYNNLNTSFTAHAPCLMHVNGSLFPPSENSEHCRRLRDWSFCLSFRVFVCLFVYVMTINSNDVIAPIAQAATPTIRFPSLSCSEAALFSPSPFLVFTSLHLAEICTLTSAF